VKALLRIIQTEYAHHQYIISTHAPEVISFSNPSSIFLVKRSGYASTVEKLALDKVETFREVAGHLGVSMADVFAADQIIWVEGPTEELCFPFLYNLATKKALPRGTIFTSVVATGDFIAKRRDKEIVYEVYQRLSAAAAPLVSSVAFSFDSEELSDADKDSMTKNSKGLMHFLPRRHLECFLINATAIATFIQGKDHPSSAPVTEQEVKLALARAAGEAFKIKEWKGDLTDETWQNRVDAAKLIAHVVSNLSEARVTFNKNRDTLALMKMVSAANPAQLAEVATYVCGLVHAACAPDQGKAV